MHFPKRSSLAIATLAALMIVVPAAGNVVAAPSDANPVAVASEAVPQANQWQQQIYEQLDAVSAKFRDMGFRRVMDIVTGSLAQGDDEYFEVQLRTDLEYVTIAVCDADCNDIDLLLYDEDEDVIDADVEYDDYPVIQGTPDYNGVYYIEAAMANCSNEPCYYGVAVYAR